MSTFLSNKRCKTFLDVVKLSLYWPFYNHAFPWPGALVHSIIHDFSLWIQRPQLGNSDNFVQPTSFDTRPFIPMTWYIFHSTSYWVLIILTSTNFLKLDCELKIIDYLKSFVVWWNLSRVKTLKNGNRLKYPHIILIYKDAVTMAHAVYYGATVKFSALNLALWVIFWGYSKNTIWHSGFSAWTQRSFENCNSDLVWACYKIFN